MLKNVNRSLCAWVGRILIVMDSAYLSKFWTWFEASLVMERCRPQELKPASNATRLGGVVHPRCHVCCGT